MTDPATTVAVIGTGTMGAGIAQVAVAAGWTARLLDVDEATARRAVDGVRARLDRLVEKGRLAADERDAAAGRLAVASDAADLGDCGLVIEAVVEDLDVKAAVLGRVIAALPGDAIVATNTSSLSVTRIGEAVGAPERTVGMHFFNPAPLMKLVEIVAGTGTDPGVVDRAAEIAAAWGKRVARAADVPGFIVNHVARPYYLEAFRLLEDGVASAAEIDEAMTGGAGFRMGPLALTDLIGQDVNMATTRSVWEQLDRPPLLRPSPLQERLVADGHLGRKTGRGVYDYAGDTPVPAVEVAPRPPALDGDLGAAVAAFADAAVDDPGPGVRPYVIARILVALIAQAARAHERGVATRADIDTALRYGTNYPRGPFEWAGRVGTDTCVRLLEALDRTVDDGRFATGL